jgi:hypothetical protein
VAPLLNLGPNFGTAYCNRQDSHRRASHHPVAARLISQSQGRAIDSVLITFDLIRDGVEDSGALCTGYSHSVSGFLVLVASASNIIT